MLVEVVLGRSWNPTLFRPACNDLNCFQFESISVGLHTCKRAWYETFPLLHLEAKPVLNDLFSDGEASKDWPSAMHDHMSISFNIRQTRWPLPSEVLYKHFAGFSLSVLLPTNERSGIFSCARRQSRLIRRCGFLVRRVQCGLARGVTLFAGPG